MYVFGGFLVVTGVKMVVDFVKEKNKTEEEASKDLTQNRFMQFVRRIFPTTDDISVPKFFRKIDNKWVATPFFLALLVIEVADLVFAIDSIPAVLAVSTDMFIVYTSNIFAILGLFCLFRIERCDGLLLLLEVCIECHPAIYWI